MPSPERQHKPADADVPAASAGAASSSRQKPGSRAVQVPANGGEDGKKVLGLGNFFAERNALQRQRWEKARHTPDVSPAPVGVVGKTPQGSPVGGGAVGGARPVQQHRGQGRQSLGQFGSSILGGGSAAPRASPSAVVGPSASPNWPGGSGAGAAGRLSAGGSGGPGPRGSLGGMSALSGVAGGQADSAVPQKTDSTWLRSCIDELSSFCIAVVVRKLECRVCELVQKVIAPQCFVMLAVAIAMQIRVQSTQLLAVARVTRKTPALRLRLHLLCGHCDKVSPNIDSRNNCCPRQQDGRGFATRVGGFLRAEARGRFPAARPHRRRQGRSWRPGGGRRPAAR